jgi:protoporphyrinogen oxidase
VKIAILGAGVSGLSLARMLTERGFPPADIALFEADAVPGGLCRSRTVNGFTYDVSGGHILFSKDKGVMQWMKEQAGGEAEFVRRERHTKIRFGNRFVHYPFENGLGDLPEQPKFECLKGYVEAWHARTASGSRAPADFKGWIHWRFGEGIARHFMEPYNEKLWKRPLAELATDWVAGRVPDAPIDDVLKAAIGVRTEGYVHQSVFYYPRSGGFQAITDGLARAVRACLRLSTPVQELVREGGGQGWRVNGERFDLVVNTLPLDRLPDVVPDMPAPAAAAMRGLSFNSIVTYLVALDRPAHPDLSWIYLPHHEQGPVNRVTYMSNYSPALAPEGKTSFLFEVTFPGHEEAPGPELEREALAGVEAAGLLRREEVLFVDRSVCRHAYIVYDHGLTVRRAAALEWCRENGIVALGRFGRYDYFNSDQCVIAAREIAERLLERARVG